MKDHLNSCGLEADLFQKINDGLPSETWQRYHELSTKRRAETLSQEEHDELIALSEQIEEVNATRISHLVALAVLRKVPVETLMDELGIPTPSAV